MNAGLGFLIELLAFAAAAYVVVTMRPRYPQLVTDAILAAIGAAMGAGALLFQDHVSVAGGVLAPPFAAFLLVAHVRILAAMGVSLPERVALPSWLDIPPLRHGRAYASAPTAPDTIEEPVQQPQSTAEPEPGPELEPMPELDEDLAPPLGPAVPAPAATEPSWPQTVVGGRTTARLPRRGARRTRVEIRRLAPISVLKFSLIFYFCVFLVVYLAMAIIWAVLSASGVIDSLEQLLGTVFPSQGAFTPTGGLSTKGAPPLEIDTGKVFTWIFIAGCVGVAIWSFINVFVAVMYNLISDIVGGVEVTLADRRTGE
jgi:Transmembrane domain of unknown function (DUF3566)